VEMFKFSEHTFFLERANSFIEGSALSFTNFMCGYFIKKSLKTSFYVHCLSLWIATE